MKKMSGLGFHKTGSWGTNGRKFDFSLSRFIPGYGFIRVAGISGVLAVVMGTYGIYKFNAKLKSSNLPAVRSKTNHGEIVEGKVLDINIMKRVGSLMVTGLTLLAGSCYYEGLYYDDIDAKQSKYIRKCTLVGGVSLLASWLTMIM